MKRWLLFLVIGCLALLPRGPATAQQDTLPAGRWVGGLAREGEWTTVVLELDAVGGGTLFAADGRQGPLENLMRSGARIELDWRGLHLSADLADDSSMWGTATVGEQISFLVLMPIKPLPVGRYDRLAGAYQMEDGRTLLLTRSDAARELYLMELETGRIAQLFPTVNERLISDQGEELNPLTDESGELIGLMVFDLRHPESSYAPVALRVELAREERIEFQQGGVALVGTLYRPPTAGLFPAVLLLHGAGAGERESYRLYATALAQQGVAALVYDRRGSGESGGAPGADLSTLAADARAGLQALAEQTEIDAGQLGLWGMSQGGRVAPLLAAEDPLVSFVAAVSTSGMSSNALELLKHEQALSRAGAPGPALELGLRYDRFAQDWQQLFNLMGATDAARDPAADWARVTQPTLLLYGAADELLPAEASAARLALALRAGGNDAVETLILPGADHNLFDHPAGGGLALAPGWPAVVGEWIVDGHLPAGTEANPAAALPYGAEGRYGQRPWMGQALPQLALMGLLVAVFVSVAVGWLRLVLRQGWRRPPVALLAYALALLDLLLFWLLWEFMAGVIRPVQLGAAADYAVPLPLRALFWLGWLSAGLALALPVTVAWSWRRLEWSAGRRAHVLLLCAAGLAFVGWLSYWQVLRPGF